MLSDNKLSPELTFTANECDNVCNSTGNYIVICEYYKAVYSSPKLQWATTAAHFIAVTSGIKITCDNFEVQVSRARTGNYIPQYLWDVIICLCPQIPGVGVTKAPFVNSSVSKIFVLAKIPLRSFESHLYLTGVTAAELRWHLSNINVIYNR